MFGMDKLHFDANGLIPAIVQDHFSGRVLTLAYMNRESLEISLREGYTCFWSRSRQELWRKGATSGNVQKITSIAPDCEQNALLVKVLPAGPACHTGAESCFFAVENVDAQHPDFSMDALFALIKGRKAEMPEGSYTTYLFEKGEDKILKKIGEECTEVIVASKNRDRGELIYEIADLAYHILVLMAEKDISLAEIRAELAGRHVVDTKVKQEYMGGQEQK